MNGKEYPNEVDLGREVNDEPVTSSMASMKKGKKRIIYPTLYIDGVEGLPMLPKEGCMMVRYRRKRMSVEENMDGKDSGGLTLEITRLCLPDEEEQTLDEVFAKLKPGEKSADSDYGYSEDEDEE